MKLYTRCKNCKSDIYFHKRATDRFKLSRKIGENPVLKCKSCLSEERYELNEIDAEESKLILVGSLIVAISVGAILIYYIWPFFSGQTNVYAISGLVGLPAIPFMFHYAIEQTHKQGVRYFNKIKYG